MTHFELPLQELFHLNNLDTLNKNIRHELQTTLAAIKLWDCYLLKG